MKNDQRKKKCPLSFRDVITWRRDIQPNDTAHIDTHDNANCDTQHNVTQHKR
jgi:hypothetical protein